MKSRCYLCVAAILTIILAVVALPAQAEPRYADFIIVHTDDPEAQDPSMFGDYDTSIKAHTAVGKVMAVICRIATPRDAEFIYAPSESLFKASESLQLWGCPNADRETFKAARERYLAWKGGQPSYLPVIYASP